MAREKYFPTVLLILDDKSSQLNVWFCEWNQDVIPVQNKYKPPLPWKMSRRPVKLYRDRKKTLPVEK